MKQRRATQTHNPVASIASALATGCVAALAISCGGVIETTAPVASETFATKLPPGAKDWSSCTNNGVGQLACETETPDVKSAEGWTCDACNGSTKPDQAAPPPKPSAWDELLKKYLGGNKQPAPTPPGMPGMPGQNTGEKNTEEGGLGGYGTPSQGQQPAPSQGQEGTPPSNPFDAFLSGLFGKGAPDSSQTGQTGASAAGTPSSFPASPKTKSACVKKGVPKGKLDCKLDKGANLLSCFGYKGGAASPAAPPVGQGSAPDKGNTVPTPDKGDAVPTPDKGDAVPTPDKGDDGIPQQQGGK